MLKILWNKFIQKVASEVQKELTMDFKKAGYKK